MALRGVLYLILNMVLRDAIASKKYLKEEELGGGVDQKIYKDKDKIKINIKIKSQEEEEVGGGVDPM